MIPTEHIRGHLVHSIIYDNACQQQVDGLLRVLFRFLWKNAIFVNIRVFKSQVNVPLHDNNA